MSFNQKILLFCIVVIGLGGWAGLGYYKKLRAVRALPFKREEVTLTIIPGWNLRQVAEYLVLNNFASTTDAVFAMTGVPAVDYRAKKVQAPVLTSAPDETASGTPLSLFKPDYVSYEGYIAPETYRVFREATLPEVLEKFINERNKEWTDSDGNKAAQALNRSPHDVLTVASIVEKETRHSEDRAKVADIIWRRLDAHWALQVDSSVHYTLDKTGDVFTTDKEREVDSPWNTYKYPGLPPGPICNPSVESINAALHPQANDYWYFLTGKDGTMYYAKTLEEHNANKKYL